MKTNCGWLPRGVQPPPDLQSQRLQLLPQHQNERTERTTAIADGASSVCTSRRVACASMGGAAGAARVGEESTDKIWTETRRKCTVGSPSSPSDAQRQWLSGCGCGLWGSSATCASSLTTIHDPPSSLLSITPLHTDPIHSQASTVQKKGGNGDGKKKAQRTTTRRGKETTYDGVEVTAQRGCLMTKLLTWNHIGNHTLGAILNFIHGDLKRDAPRRGRLTDT